MSKVLRGGASGDVGIPRGIPFAFRGPMENARFNLRVSLVAGFAMAGLVAILCMNPVPQDPRYHDFADQRPFLGIPHFWNVVSNLPFVIAGAAGLLFLLRGGGQFHERWERGAWGVLLAAVFLVGFGSAYYHAGPSTATLFWDRVPMTMMFSAFLAITIGERMRPAWGARLLVPLLAAGLGTLLYWRAGELRGAGDLRGYGLLQGLAMTAIPVMMLLFPASYSRERHLWSIVLLYAAAKFFETFDAPIHALLGGQMSGHAIKHMIAGVAAWRIYTLLRRREPLPLPERAPMMVREIAA